MDTLANAVLGTLFLCISASLTFLMFYLWGFPFDHEQHKSSAPKSLMRLHRILGYAYAGIYIYFMIQMVPRMWTYQIELPARTVAHMMLGMSIGAILIVKIIIVRYYKHLETTLVPPLGTLLFICSVLLTGLSVPSAMREHALRTNAIENDALTDERQTVIQAQLQSTGIDSEERIQALTTRKGLLAGRSVLVNKCVQCHDLRTVLARPRTPDAWQQTITRMANRSTVLSPITSEEQEHVLAYLVAISPTLQQTVKLKRQQESEANQLVDLRENKSTRLDSLLQNTPFDAEQAALLFSTRCSMCHNPQQVELAPPATNEDAKALVQRMVRNGLVAPEEELSQIIRHIQNTFVANVN